MAEPVPELQLADPQPLAGLRPLALAVVGLVSVGLGAAVLWHAPAHEALPSRVPTHAADLASGPVTPVEPGDHAGIRSAVEALRLSESQRREVERSALAGRRRLAWIVFTDSIDPDGDAVAVEAGGLTQHVVLTKAWMPVAVPLSDTGTIGITAVTDGGGGGITVALMTRSGALTARVMLPGERIQVVSP